jgi:propanediol dehydratase small subunit
MKKRLSDYPLAETQPHEVKGRRGKPLEDITLDTVLSGEVTMDDLGITPSNLKSQAEIAREAGRPTLAENFERAAELVDVPQDQIMQIYELLRPGRAKSKEELLQAALSLRQNYKAELIAVFVEEAAHTYERRGLFNRRF